MKHTKKLIPALGMLLLSASMLVTSTFAWFSMNESVKATGMTVGAKGEQVYLQISKEQFSNADNGLKKVDIDFSTDTKADLFPAAVMTKENSALSAYDGGDETKFVWVSAKGTDAQNGAKPTGDAYTEVATGSLGDYRLEKTMYIRLDPTAGADKASKELKVSGVAFKTGQQLNNMAQCISVLVVGDGLSQLFKYNNDTSKFVEATGSDEKLTAAAFAEMDTGLEVTVYVFFDGDNPLCTLQNLAAAKAEGGINNFAVDVSFTCA